MRKLDNIINLVIADIIIIVIDFENINFFHAWLGLDIFPIWSPLQILLFLKVTG